MKELSIKEKAQRYDEAIKLAKDSYSYPSYPGFIRADVVFPELKESEDEKIRKELIEYIKDQQSSFISAPDCRDKYEEEENNKYNSWIAWLEKQGEQKPADKIEPKFKVGDWMVYEENIYQIHNIGLKKYYDCLRTDGAVLTFDFEYIDSKSHLWTIQDAKAGDVLADDYGIYIFEKFDECDRNCYVCIGAYQYSQKVYECEHMLCSTDAHPATKEQRDLLFKKMHEAGYKWDAEKKELKKIEHNAWSEEDEKIRKELIEEVKDQLNCVPAPDCRDKEDEKALKQLNKWLTWLKSLRPQSQWRPSDEQMDAFIEKACEFLDGCIPDYIDLEHDNVDTFMNVDNKRFIEDFKKYIEK